jgi:hypothetical protein
VVEERVLIEFIADFEGSSDFDVVVVDAWVSEYVEEIVWKTLWDTDCPFEAVKDVVGSINNEMVNEIAFV